MKRRVYTCDGCNKDYETDTFWISGQVQVEPHTGGVYRFEQRTLRPYEGPVSTGRKRTKFHVCSVECLGKMLESGPDRFMKPRSIAAGWLDA
jgi:hypothetical protein